MRDQQEKNIITKFLIFCSGADSEILKECPSIESNKYASIGIMVLVTGIFAFISGFYTLYSLFNQEYNISYVIGLSLLWSLLVFSLDRYLVSSMRKRYSLRAQVFVALPRIIIALLISIIIAKPFEVKIFENRIVAHINEIKSAENAQLKAKIESTYRLSELRDEVKDKIDQRNKLRDRLYSYYEKGSKERKEITYRWLIEEDIEKTEHEINFSQNQLAHIDSVVAKEIQKAEYSNYSVDFIFQIEALSDLKKEPFTTQWWTGNMILLLFIVIGTAPVLAILISERSTYDFILEKSEEYTIQNIIKEKELKFKLEEEKRVLDGKLEIDLKRKHAGGGSPSDNNHRKEVEIEKKIKKDPKNVTLIKRLAHLKVANDKYQEALELYDKLIQIQPDKSEYWFEKAQVYDNMGEKNKYLKTLRKAEKLKDKDSFEQNLTKKIVLQTLEIQNLDFFDNLKWTMQPQINVLLGKNGYGKSHLTRALIAVLQNEEDKSSEFFYDNQDDSFIKIALSTDNENNIIHRTQTVFEESIGKIPVLAIPDTRFINKSVTAISQVEDDKSDLKGHGAYHYLYQAPYEPMIQTFLHQLCIDYGYKNKRFDLPIFDLIQEIVQELTDKSFAFHKIEPTGSSRFKIEVITEGNENNPLPIQKASQGTLSVLAMFGLIYYYLKSVFPDNLEKEILNKPAIVLIDEIDAHLHPSWQQKIIRLLREKFPNIQFIVTAHSPLVVAGCLDGEVAVLQKGNSGFIVKQFEKDFIGATASELYSKLFEIEDIDETYLYYATQHSIDKYSKRINELESKKRLTTEEEKELHDLFKHDYYSSKIADINKDKEARNYEVQIESLEAKIRELEYRLDIKSKK